MARIGLIGENSIEYVDKLLDIWNNGDCAVLIDWRIPFQTAYEMMKEADVEKYYIEKDINDLSNKENLDIEHIIFPKHKMNASTLSKDVYDKFNDNYEKKEAVVIYSSGTTGKSKGVILSHYAINTNADAIIDYMQPTINDCIYIAKTLSHSSTLTGELLVSLKTKMRTVIAPTVVPPRYVLSNINKFSVSIICLNPSLLYMYALETERKKLTFPSLKNIYVSGSILNDKTYSYAHKVFSKINIYNVYGLSEAGPRVTAQTKGNNKTNSVGKPIKGVKIHILNNNKEIIDGKQGVVYVETPCKFLGYVTNNKKFDSLYNWVNSGDVGYIDSNSDLHITGRIDNIIVIDSHKIYPYSIEEKIVSYDGVRECVVLKNNMGGRDTLCCLYSSNKKINKMEIIRFLSNYFSYYEIPKVYVPIHEIPKNNNYKYDMCKINKEISSYINKNKENLYELC